MDSDFLRLSRRILAAKGKADAALKAEGGKVTGDLEVTEQLRAAGGMKVDGGMKVTGDMTLAGKTSVGGNLNVAGGLTIDSGNSGYRELIVRRGVGEVLMTMPPPGTLGGSGGYLIYRENADVKGILRLLIDGKPQYSANGNTYHDIWHSGSIPIEAGYWTPVLYGSTTAGSPAYNSRYGVYTRIGNLVFCRYWVNISNKNTVAGEIRVSGLPFAVLNDEFEYYTVHPAYSTYGISLASGYGLQGFVIQGSVSFGFRIPMGASGFTTLATTHIATGASLGGQLIYRTAT